MIYLTRFSCKLSMTYEMQEVADMRQQVKQLEEALMVERLV
jgi:hypothetical protein